jgi:aminomethyltransferase
MTVVSGMHADHGATFLDRDGRRVVDHYGRPESAHRAVRNGVGVIEMGYGVVTVAGDDRHPFVDDTVSNRVPEADGEGVYAFLLDPQGRIETDMYVYNAGERLLVFTPPAKAGPLADDWASKTFVQDVTVEAASDAFGVFGVHGPTATEKVASVLVGSGAPEPDPPLSFVRGAIDDVGVTVVASDAPTGEEGYEVICAAADAAAVFDSLLTRGTNAAPFGYRTWETLTLEAGTPAFETELAGRLPNVVGAANGYDLSKGCFVGQETVSKVANRGRPSGRLVGVRADAVPGAGADVRVRDGDGDGGGRVVGTVTRAAATPSADGPIGLAIVDYDVDATELTVGDGIDAARVALPFVAGSARSARLPRYDD